MELPVKSSGRKTQTYRIETINLSCKLDSSSSNRCLDLFNLQKSSPSNASKLLLHDVNCEAKPGEITAIAGPSGAGKTTLLEILAGKISTRRVSGHILVNGRPVNSRHFRRISGYVTQEDALFPLLTVQETLMYSLLLKLPVGSQEEADVRVKEVMKDLGLDHVFNSRVGDASNSGISGGERRRVSIGVELVHDPAIILIDEPTSGLDSASALHVITLLKSMVVSQGKTVILTIHQPGFRILQLLDRILLLSNGLVMHNGSLNLLEARVKKVGHCIPRHVNVLEFAIDLTSSSVLQPLATTPDNHEVSRNSNGPYTIRQPSPNLIVEDQKPLAYANSRFKEVLILGQRFCKNIFRTKQLFATRVVQALVAGFILGSIFINRGKNHNLDATALQARIGFFAFSLTFLLSSTTEGLPIFLQERRILMRETSGGAYRVSSYVLSNTCVFIPFLLMVGLLFTTPVYWLIGLRREFDGFLYFSLVVWMVLLMSNSFVACFSALVPNFIMGNSVISGFMGSFFLFSGYFIAEKNIPRYWVFMHYLSLFKYPFECFMINEYGGKQGKRCIEFDGGGCIMYGAEFLEQQDFRESRKWSNLGIMLCFIVGYRLFSFLILWIRCYKVRNKSAYLFTTT